MKAIIKCFILTVVILSFSSCSDKSDNDPLVCNDPDTLLVLEDRAGTMKYLPCYDSWAVDVDDLDNDTCSIIGASKDISDEFKSDGMAVTISGCYYEFDLPLLLPDPAGWCDLYVIRNFSISEAE